jgi:hypothetical protein
MFNLRRQLIRLRRGIRHGATLALALARTAQRRLVREALLLARTLPGLLDQPLPQALAALTPAPEPSELDNDTIRAIVDGVAAFGAGRPLGICLRRSLLRYYFLRRAGLPVTVVFGARRRGDGIGGHAWLVLNGAPYHELPEHYREFAVMFAYPSPLAHAD